MRKLMKRKVNLFGKEISVFVIALFAIVLVSATLLTYYGAITGNAIVSQSVTLDGVQCTDDNVCTQEGAWDAAFIAGDSVSDCDHTVKNNANVEETVKFTTICTPDCDGITTDVYGVLELSTKNTDTWEVDGTEATVKYTIVGSTFSAEVIEGVITNYELIYYKDAEDAQTVAEREANPQPAIQIASVSGDLPYADDGNVQYDANYCQDPDHYEHCKGAKIWYVPSNALLSCDNGVCVIDWSQWGTFLYETDLIVYSDATDETIDLPSKGGFNFCVDNDFAINLRPNTYEITTTINPVA